MEDNAMRVVKLSVVIATALIVGHMIFARGDYEDQLDSPVYRSTLKDALERFRDSELLTSKDGVNLSPGLEGSTAPPSHSSHKKLPARKYTTPPSKPSRPSTPYPGRTRPLSRPSTPYSKPLLPRTPLFPNSPPSKEVEEARQAYFKRDYDGAEKMFSVFLKQNPGHVAARYYLGNCLMAQRKYAEALPLYEQCIKDAPDNAQLYQSLGSAYRTNKQPDKAIAAVEKALKIDPDSEYTQRLLASLYRSAGKKDKYEELTKRQEANYKAKLAKEPNNAEHCSNLANLYLQLGRNLEEALKLAQNACKLKSDEARYYSLQANVLKRLKRFDEALASINRAIEIDPRSRTYPLVKKQIERMQSSKQ